MITPGGDVKILDFGVAKLLEESLPSSATKTAVATEEGTTVGTPSYMSPEQAEGRALDGRSDIFSFGCVLYEMMTGRLAFSGASRLSILAKVLNEDPAPPSRHAPSMPPDLEKTILRCLRKDPARRYQTMADLKVALEDLEIESSASKPVVAPAQPRSRSRTWALIAIGGALAIAAYVGARMWLASSADEPLRAVPLTSLSGVLRSPSLSPDGNHVAFTWTGPKQDNPDIYVQQVGTAGTPLRLTTDAGNDYGPSYSPDGRAIAFLRRLPSGTGSEVWLIPPLGGPERKVAEIQSRFATYRPISVSWCPDSTCVLVPDSIGDGKQNGIFVIDTDSRQKRQLTTAPADAADVDPTISRDGRSLVFRRDTTPFSGQFYRLSLKDGVVPAGEPTRLTTTLAAGKPTWTADGREIVFASRGALWRVDALTGGTPTRLPFVGQDGSAPVVAQTPGGKQRLVYIRSFADTNIWRVDTPAAGAPAPSPPVVAIASTRGDHLPAVSPDGSRVTFLSTRSGEHELWVAAPDGSNAMQLTMLGANPGFPRWSADGKFIVFHGDPQGRPDVLMIPASGGKPTVMTASIRNGAFPSFSGDGRWIYYSAADAGQLMLWKLPVAGGAPVKVTAALASVSIESRNGRDLYYVDTADRPTTLWRLPLSGGAAEKIVEGVILGAFDVLEGGIYYLDRASGEAGGFYTDRPGGETRLQYFNFSTRQTTTVARGLGVLGPGLGASRDGRTIYFTRIDSAVDELILVENFR
jgi:Tol biopolymer transport system component